MLETKTQTNLQSITTKRRPRFQRDPEELNKPFKLTRQDLETFQHLANTRVLSSEQLASLLIKSRAQSKTEIQHIIRRLRRLYDRGYLDRPGQQLYHQIILGRSAGGLPLIYALGKRAAEVLAAVSGDEAIQSLNRQKNNRECKAMFLDHSLMVANVYTTCNLFLAKTPNLKFGSWQEGDELRDAYYLDSEGNLVTQPHESDLKAGKLSRYSVNPDAHFSLSRTDTPASLHFFLEADRSTEDLARFQDKAKKYLAWKHLKLHTKKFSIQNFVVLTVTLSERRMENLRLAVQEVTPPEEFSLFRFTCEEYYQKDPHSFRQKIWLCPHSDARLSIFQ